MKKIVMTLLMIDGSIANRKALVQLAEKRELLFNLYC